MAVEQITNVRDIITLLNVIIGTMSVVFLVAFYLRWQYKRHNLSMMAFYAKWKFVKHNIVMGFGVITLTLSLIVEFLVSTGFLLDPMFQIFKVALQMISVSCFGYSYFKLARLDTPE